MDELKQKLIKALRNADNQLHDERVGRTERLAQVAIDIFSTHVEELERKFNRLEFAAKQHIALKRGGYTAFQIALGEIEPREELVDVDPHGGDEFGYI